jgi:hypothetical protein
VATEPRREPWPFIVMGMLGAMISVSLLFLWTAIAHPDPPVVDDAYRAGLEYAERFERPGLPRDPDPDPAVREATP